MPLSLCEKAALFVFEAAAAGTGIVSRALLYPYAYNFGGCASFSDNGLYGQQNRRGQLGLAGELLKQPASAPEQIVPSKEAEIVSPSEMIAIGDAPVFINSNGNVLQGHYDISALLGFRRATPNFVDCGIKTTSLIRSFSDEHAGPLAAVFLLDPEAARLVGEWVGELTG